MNTEERIVKAFKEMSRYQGFYAVRMEDLAAKSGITKKTIYSYFTSKKDLVEKTVDAFISEVTYKIEDGFTKSELVEVLSLIIESLLREGAFLFNVQSMKDLQVYYPDTWQRIEDFRVSMINSVVEVIFNRSKKKWITEIDPIIFKEAFLAMNRRFSSPECALEIGMPVEELTLQFAKLLIYPYL